MKILLSGNTGWSIWNFRRELIAMLLDRGDKVWVFAPLDQYTDKLQEIGCHCVDMKIDGKGKNPLREWKLYRDFVTLYKKERFDFVIHYTIKPVIYGSIAARKSRLKTINVITGLGDAFKKEGLFNRFITALYKFSLRGDCKVFFLNKENSEVFSKKKIIPHEAINILPSEGIDLDHFSYRSFVQNTSIKFLFIGRILKEKGTEILFRAFQQVKETLPDARIELVFQGFLDVSNETAVSEAEMKQWTETDGVSYLPPTEDVRESVEQADCVVLPSFYGEGIPRSLLEAAAMGRPIITTDNIGCRDVVIDGTTGYLCRVKDVNSLAEQMIRFIKLSSEQQVAMGVAGHDYVKAHFSIEQVLENYRSLLK